MVLLFVALLLRRERDTPQALGRVADGLLGNLGLLFIPAGVGVILYLPLLARDWAPISLAIVLGTLASIAVTGRLAQSLLRHLGQ
jgi:holin-like protein